MPSFAIKPALAISLKSQAAESHFPASARPPRSTYTDVTLQGGIGTSFERGAFALQTKFDVVGSSYRPEALRYNLLGLRAPRLDLPIWAAHQDLDAS